MDKKEAIAVRQAVTAVEGRYAKLLTTLRQPVEIPVEVRELDGALEKLGLLRKELEGLGDVARRLAEERPLTFLSGAESSGLGQEVLRGGAGADRLDPPLPSLSPREVQIAEREEAVSIKGNAVDSKLPLKPLNQQAKPDASDYIARLLERETKLRDRSVEGSSNLSQADLLAEMIEEESRKRGQTFDREAADPEIKKILALRREREANLALHKGFGDLRSGAIDSLSGALQRGLLGGGDLKTELGTAARGLAQRTLGQFLELGLFNPLQNLFGGNRPTIGTFEGVSQAGGFGGIKEIGGSLASFALSILGGVFNGFRADGGPVERGRAYIVGERGPELFLPGASGHILPNGEDPALAGLPGLVLAASRGEGQGGGQAATRPVTVKQNLTFNMNGGGEGLADPQVMEDVQRELQNRTVELIENTLIRHLRLGGILNPY